MQCLKPFANKLDFFSIVFVLCSVNHSIQFHNNVDQIKFVVGDQFNHNNKLVNAVNATHKELQAE